jgi:hypothetical protein
MGLLRPPANFVWTKPDARLWFTVAVVFAEVVKEVADSVPVTVALSEYVPPMAALTAPVIVTVHIAPAATLAAVQVSTGAA